MHKYSCALLILLALLAGDALAQGIGIGIGVDDVRKMGAGTAAPATFLLLNSGTGGPYILLNAGGKIQCNAC